MRKGWMLLVVATALLTLGATAEAVPTLTGEINFGGSLTTNTGNLGTATAITFTNPAGVVDPTTGSFSVIPSFPSDLPAFTFATFSPVSWVGFAPITDLWTLTHGGLVYHFDLLTLSVSQGATFLNLFGTGVMYVTDEFTNALVYAETNSSFFLSTQGSPAGSFSFSANTEAVPEPGTLLLIGSGLAGLALRRRRKA